MTGLEIALLIIGFVIFIVSFLFSSKFEPQQQPTPEQMVELTEKQRESIKREVLEIFDEQLEHVEAKTEAKMEMLSTNKIQEMNEYSKTILDEIDRNHNEVMFLYDMLNEKKKEVNNVVRDINAARKEVEKVKQDTVKLQSEPVAAEDIGFMAGEAILKEEKKAAAKKTRTKADTQITENAAEAETKDNADSAAAPAEKPKRKRTTAKTAADRARTTIMRESSRVEQHSVQSLETGNNNEKILELNRQGKSNVEIAKELGLGIGEVKLVIDLFRGGRA